MRLRDFCCTVTMNPWASTNAWAWLAREEQFENREATVFYQNDYITKNITTQKMNEYLQQAEKDRLLLTLDTQQDKPIFQFARSFLHNIGHLLSASGRRLEQLEVPSCDVKLSGAAPSK